MFGDIFSMPIAYDMGIDIKTHRKRKSHRKGVKMKSVPKKEVIQISSKEMADIAGEALAKVFTKMGDDEIFASARGQS